MQRQIGGEGGSGAQKRSPLHRRTPLYGGANTARTSAIAGRSRWEDCIVSHIRRRSCFHSRSLAVTSSCVKWLVRKNRALSMSKNDDELNEFIDEVTDGAYNLPSVEVIFNLVSQMQPW